MERLDIDQTDRAISVIQKAVSDSGKPLPEPEMVKQFEAAALEGDEDAYIAAMAAKLRIIFPDTDRNAYSGYMKIVWKSIMEGRLEGILIAEKLDYERAFADGAMPALGSYFERWLSGYMKREANRIIAEGGYNTK